MALVEIRRGELSLNEVATLLGAVSSALSIWFILKVKL